jgi:hypothetical protein
VKRTVLLRSVSLALLACAAAGCRTATEPRGSVALEVTARATPSRIHAGETAWLDVVIRNTSSHPQAIPGGPAAFVEVRDESGRVVGFGRFGILALIAYPPRSLAPGDTAVDRAPWPGEVDGDRVAPGRYRIRAAVPVMDGAGGSYAYSTPVVVEVVADRGR